MEDIAALGFLLLGLGFFSFIIWLIVTTVGNDNERDYKRLLAEKREFGIELPRERKSKRHQRA